MGNRVQCILEYNLSLLRSFSVPKKLACGDLFRQNKFPLLANIGVLRAGRAQPLYLLTPLGRFQRGRGNAQGNLAAQGFRIHRTCRWIRISFGGPAEPPKRVFDSQRHAFPSPKGGNACLFSIFAGVRDSFYTRSTCPAETPRATPSLTACLPLTNTWQLPIGRAVRSGPGAAARGSNTVTSA